MDGEVGVKSVSVHCPECGSIDIFLDKSRGEEICRSCGLVINDKKIDYGPDWNPFINVFDKDTTKRACYPTTLGKLMNFHSTIIDYRNKDLEGKRISSHNQHLAEILRKTHRLFGKGKFRNNQLLTQGLLEIKRVCGILQLPQVVVINAL